MRFSKLPPGAPASIAGAPDAAPDAAIWGEATAVAVFDLDRFRRRKRRIPAASTIAPPTPLATTTNCFWSILSGPMAVGAFFLPAAAGGATGDGGGSIESVASNGSVSITI